MIIAKCPHCETVNRDPRATGSSRLHSVYKTKKETESFHSPAFDVIPLRCEHCEEIFFAAMLDQRW